MTNIIVFNAETDGHVVFLADALQDISSFDKSQLKPAKTAEPQSTTMRKSAPSNPWHYTRPCFYRHLSCFVVVQEKTVSSIAGFDKTTLKHADTTEKASLPDTTGAKRGDL